MFFFFFFPPMENSQLKYESCKGENYKTYGRRMCGYATEDGIKQGFDIKKIMSRDEFNKEKREEKNARQRRKRKEINNLAKV